MARKFTRVPELSLKAFTHGGAKERTDFIDALMEGFQYYGFIILKDHAVRRDLLKRAYELSAAFFALPEAEKRRYIAGVDGQRGYTPFGKEHAKDAKVADLKEFWHVGREFDADSPLAKTYPMNVRPAQPKGFRETFLELYDALEDAGLSMLEALAPSLGVADDYFRKMATDGNSILRLLHYPPIGREPPPGRCAPPRMKTSISSPSSSRRMAAGSNSSIATENGSPSKPSLTTSSSTPATCSPARPMT